jgi:hypothetical protein
MFIQGAESLMLLQHDNARPHVSTATSEVKENIGFEAVLHCTYSLNLVPSDFSFLAPLK